MDHLNDILIDAFKSSAAPATGSAAPQSIDFLATSPATISSDSWLMVDTHSAAPATSYIDHISASASTPQLDSLFGPVDAPVAFDFNSHSDAGAHLALADSTLSAIMGSGYHN